MGRTLGSKRQEEAKEEAGLLMEKGAKPGRAERH